MNNNPPCIVCRRPAANGRPYCTDCLLRETPRERTLPEELNAALDRVAAKRYRAMIAGVAAQMKAHKAAILRMTFTKEQ